MVLIVDRKRSIGEVAKEVGVQEHVIRFWGTEFSEYVKPTLGAGKRRYYFDKDVKILKTIKHYLYEEGLTIRGLRNLFKNETVKIDNFQDKVVNDSRTDNYSANVLADNSNIKTSLREFKYKLNNFYEKIKNII
jgi:DNA-binding transcriptional MerR regulator